MKIMKNCLLVIIIGLLLSGCACCQVGSGDKEGGSGGGANAGSHNGHESTYGNVSLAIYSNPSNAAVFINNNSRGYTPFLSLFPGGGYYLIELKKDGYEPYRAYHILSKSFEINVSLVSKIGSSKSESSSEKPINISSNATIPRKPESSDSVPQSFPYLSPQIILIVLACLSLLIGPNILERLVKYRNNVKKNKKKESHDIKAFLSASKEQQEKNLVTIKITNKGKADARDYCITFTGKIKEEKYDIKRIDKKGYVIPAKDFISVQLECDNWVEICVDMKWDDDFESDRISKMCFPLKPL